MTFGKEKSRTGTVVYGIVTLALLGGIGLCITGLLLPNWAEVTWEENIVVVTANIGLYRHEICDYTGCKTYWKDEDGYDAHPKATFKSVKDIRGVETSGVIISGVALLALIPLWASRGQSFSRRVWAQFFFFSQCLSSAFLTLTGTLMASADVKSDDVGWAPLITGAGSALLFVAAITSCIYCRYDQTYGTLENPVNRANLAPLEEAHNIPQMNEQPQPQYHQIRL